MNRPAVVILAACLHSLPVFAQEDNTPVGTGDFNCFPREAFSDAAADTPQIRINNFSIRESQSLLSNGAFSIEVSYAVANRMAQPISVSADFVLFDDRDVLLAALNAGPMLDTVQPGKTETGSGDTFVSEGTLGRAKKICLRIYTTWRQ